MEGCMHVCINAVCRRFRPGEYPPPLSLSKENSPPEDLPYENSCPEISLPRRIPLQRAPPLGEFPFGELYHKKFNPGELLVIHCMRNEFKRKMPLSCVSCSL